MCEEQDKKRCVGCRVGCVVGVCGGGVGGGNNQHIGYFKQWNTRDFVLWLTYQDSTVVVTPGQYWDSTVVVTPGQYCG